MRGTASHYVARYVPLVEKSRSAIEQKHQISEPAKMTHVSQHPVEGQLAVLFATALVNVADRSGEMYPSRALIDQRSKASIISEALA